MLKLLAKLSKEIGQNEAARLVQESIRERPMRSRRAEQVMAGDIRRAHDKIRLVKSQGAIMSGVQEQGANGEGEESEEGKEDEESRREYETAEEDKEMGRRESRAAARRHGVACGCS